MRFSYTNVANWAPLAWAAMCRPGAIEIEVLHGSQVETRPLWFCEAAWPGRFDDGDFDRTDLVVGTGGRIRDATAKFVAPGNTVDRIVSVRNKGCLFVSNSLGCLAAISGARAEPSYARYYEDFCTIVRGLRAYKRTIPSTVGEIHSCFFGCLVWNGEHWSHEFHDTVRRDFGTYETYVRFLRDSLRGVADNIAATGRAYHYTFLSTLSSGYDSVAVSTLAREAGCQSALCITRDRFGHVENGPRIAGYLGLTAIPVERGSWREAEGRDILFVSADGTSEAVPLVGAERHLRRRVLLTGYHGDKVWARDTKNLSDEVVRGDSSGLSLSEYRLWAGFIHCPLPFWGVKQIRELNALSKSDEMKPWHVGGDYSRPIPRRIAESAGIPREEFGHRKCAAAVSFAEFLCPGSLDNYLSWLRQRRLQWLRRGRIPPPVNLAYERLETSILDFFDSKLRKTPLLWRLAPDNELDRPTRLRRYAFPWALDSVAQMYRAAMES